MQALDCVGLRTVPLDDFGSIVSGKPAAAAERCRFLARSYSRLSSLSMLPTLTLRQLRGSLLPPCFRASSSVRSQSSSAAGSRIRHPGVALALIAVERRWAADPWL